MKIIYGTLAHPISIDLRFKTQMKYATLLVLFPLFFYLLFQPGPIINGLSDQVNIIILLGFGLIAAVFRIIFYLIIPRLIRKPFLSFTVRKTIYFNASMVCIAGIFSYLYYSFFHEFDNLTLKDIIVTLKRSLVILIAILPVLSLGIYYHFRQMGSIILNSNPVSRASSIRANKRSVVIISDNEKEILRIHPDKLLAIESAKNYVMVYFESDGKTVKKLIRTSLSKLEAELTSESLLRCHRSHFVNLKKVEYTTGNSRALFIKIKGIENCIPVSRIYVKKITQELRLLA